VTDVELAAYAAALARDPDAAGGVQFVYIDRRLLRRLARLAHTALERTASSEL